MLKLVRPRQLTFDITESMLIFSFSALVFHFILYNTSNDITDHLVHVKNLVEGRADYPVHFGFFLVVKFCFEAFDINLINLGIIILAFSNALKYFISKKIIFSYEPNLKTKLFNKNSLLTLALFFCFAIPDPYSIFVLGQLSVGKFIPIVWHNSTLTFVFPFAILLFWVQLKVLDSKELVTKFQILILSILVILNIIIKPSFVMVYIPVTFIFLVKKFRYRMNSEFFYNLIPVALGGFAIMAQSILIFQFQSGNIHEVPSGIGICEPFKIIRHWVPLWYIPIGFILSFLFPLLTALTYREIFEEISFRFASYLVIAGIIIGAFVFETGPRMFHGNFLWQNVICAYLLFISTFIFFVKNILIKTKWSRKDKLIICALTLHVISGLFYVLKIVISKDYL
jgi:hypothetical protein